MCMCEHVSVGSMRVRSLRQGICKRRSGLRANLRPRPEPKHPMRIMCPAEKDFSAFFMEMHETHGFVLKKQMGLTQPPIIVIALRRRF